MDLRRSYLTEAMRERIMAAKGQQNAAVLAEACGVSVNTIHNVWQKRNTGQRRSVTEADREIILNAYAKGADIQDCMVASGWAENTVRLVIYQARAGGDLRSHSDPEIRRQAIVSEPDNKAPAPKYIECAAPNSVELSLIMRGMRPEVARMTARVWAEKHAQKKR